MALLRSLIEVQTDLKYWFHLSKSIHVFDSVIACYVPFGQLNQPSLSCTNIATGPSWVHATPNVSYHLGGLRPQTSPYKLIFSTLLNLCAPQT